MLYVFVLLLAFVFVFSIVIFTIRNGISPMPTGGKVKEEIFTKALPKEMQGRILELGAGWGTLVFPLAKRYPQACIDAYENSWIPWLFLYFRVMLSSCQNIKLHRSDFFQESFQGSSLVICYLYPGAMEKLKDKFEKELALDTIILSHTFAIPGWSPEHVIHVDDMYNSKIYIYRINPDLKVRVE